MVRRFGKYELLDSIGTGGMAEVWRARVRGPAGFSKEVALMLIQVKPWGDVWLDEVRLGQTPLSPVEVAAGRHRVVVSNPESGHQQRRVEVAAGERTFLEIDLTQREH
jgi:PEGA domain-containing protein